MNTQFLHLRIQRRPLQTEDFSSATLSPDSPPIPLQHAHDVPALHILEVTSTGRFRGWLLGRLNNQGFVAAHDHGMLDHVSQFSDVARPRIGLQCLHALFRNADDLLSHPLLELLNECPDHERNVLGTVTEGWNDNREDIQAIEEVSPEFSFGHLPRKIPVGSSNNADICVHIPRRPQTLKVTRLDHTEQLALQFKGKFADLIEKQRGSIGDFEPTGQLGQSPSVSTLLSSEKLAFNQRGRREAQLTVTRGRSFRPLILWIALASSSFPVPVSPMRRTVDSVGATFSA
jgi:hypothetical protein